MTPKKYEDITSYRWKLNNNVEKNHKLPPGHAEKINKNVIEN